MSWKYKFSETQLQRRRENQRKYQEKRRGTPEYKEYLRLRYLKNHNKLKISSKERLLSLKVTDLGYKTLVISRARSRAKRSNIEFDISVEDIIFHIICPVLGLELNTNKRTSKFNTSDETLSLDRVDNSLGYIKGNVRSISYKANKLKNNMTKEECRMILENWDKF